MKFIKITKISTIKAQPEEQTQKNKTKEQNQRTTPKNEKQNNTEEQNARTNTKEQPEEQNAGANERTNTKEQTPKNKNQRTNGRTNQKNKTQEQKKKNQITAPFRGLFGTSSDLRQSPPIASAKSQGSSEG